MGRRDEYLKIKVLESALKGRLYLSISLFLFMTSLSLLLFLVVGLSGGGGLWFGIFGLIATILGNYFVRGRPGNPLKFPIWALLNPYGRVLKDREFSKSVEKYVEQIHSETDPRPLRILTFLPPIGMILVSLNSAALRLDITIAAVIVGISYGLGAWPIIEAWAWYKAKSPRRISQFFGVPESMWKRIDLMGPPVHRPASITYISIPYLAVGAFGILASVLTILSVPPFITKYNPVAFGAVYMFICTCILWIGRWLLQMRAEGAWLAGGAAGFVSILSSVILIGTLLRPTSFQNPIFMGSLTLIGFCISISILWVLKKHWRKFSRGLGQFATLGEPPEEKR